MITARTTGTCPATVKMLSWIVMTGTSGWRSIKVRHTPSIINLLSTVLHRAGELAVVHALKVATIRKGRFHIRTLQ
jgi:hypothetical protein